jgi:hypothetical protein
LQTDDAPTYRITEKVAMHHKSSPGFQMNAMTYVVDSNGLLVTRGRSVTLVPWASLRFLHLHVTSGVGTTGFPVYSARLRTLFRAREFCSVDWQEDECFDRSADYVPFLEELIKIAVARNPRLRLRYGGDPLLEGAIPTVLSVLIVPFALIPILIFKPLGALFAGWSKAFGKPMAGAITMIFGVLVNMVPWSTGKPFKADSLPSAELPPKYRRGVA